MPPSPSRLDRARRHAALGEPTRLAIADELTRSDRSPAELARLVGVASNLLAHHLDVLEQVGLVERGRSSGDGRRRYVHLRPGALDGLRPGRPAPTGGALFVCTANSARSPLAAALWRRRTGRPATSAGTHPAERTHPGAVAAARRAGLELAGGPTALDDRAAGGAVPGVAVPGVVVTVCDRAHEELDPDPSWLHWSVPDPVARGTAAAFDETVRELTVRIDALVAAADDEREGSP